MKRPDDSEMKRLREELFDDIEAGRIDLPEATRKMRRTLGMNRKDYAAKVLKIGFETLQDVETGRGNPTLKTLRAIGAPFGLKVGFVRKRAEETYKHMDAPPAQDQRRADLQNQRCRQLQDGVREER